MINSKMKWNFRGFNNLFNLCWCQILPSSFLGPVYLGLVLLVQHLHLTLLERRSRVYPRLRDGLATRAPAQGPPRQAAGEAQAPQ